MPKKVNQVSRFFVTSILTMFIASQQLAFSAELNIDLPEGQALKLMGIGMHQELRNDIYIGALFGPAEVSNAEDLKDDAIPKRMSIRLVTNYSHRKMSRHWKERLAMNNPRDMWQPLTKEIVQFSRIFKRSMQTGDELNIDYVPGKGTKVYLNGTLFQTIEKQGFAELLLNVWLGTTPPTKAFKKSIRGQDDNGTQEKYVDTYSALQPIKGRFDADLQPETRVAKAEPSKAVAKKPQEKPKSQSSNNTKVATSNPPKKKEEVKKPASKPQTKVAQNTKQSESKEKTKVAESDSKKSMKNDEDNLLAADLKIDSGISSVLKDSGVKAAEAKPKTSEPKAEKVAKIEKQEEVKLENEEDFFDADLISGSYTRDLLSEIRKFQEYPKKALQKNEEGEVIVKVTINAAGEVENIDYLEKSGSRVLDKAVVRMVRKAAPFQAIPKELKMEKFEFEVPIEFKL